MLKTALALGAVLLISGCHQDSPATTSDDQQTTNRWVGRWVGVEGLFLEISQDDTLGPAHYTLEMQYGLDAEQSGIFEGQATGEGIVFTRDDGEHLLRAGNGEDTGLKWLAEKDDCLIVQPGEGYCRDQ